MLSVEEARERILARVRLTEAEELPLLEAAGRVPAVASVTAAVDVPPFANSSMDGFALRAADAPGELPVTGDTVLGRVLAHRRQPHPVGHGEGSQGDRLEQLGQRDLLRTAAPFGEPVRCCGCSRRRQHTG